MTIYRAMEIAEGTILAGAGSALLWLLHGMSKVTYGFGEEQITQTEPAAYIAMIIPAVAVIRGTKLLHEGITNRELFPDLKNAASKGLEKVLKANYSLGGAHI